MRYHRDQKGDNRCWVDDLRLWELLPDTPIKPSALPSYDEMMKRCTAYYRHRRAEAADPVPSHAIVDTTRWDTDLSSMGEAALEQELERLQVAVLAHRDIQGRERTLDDDRALYRVLPEQVTADFRLPNEADFLGEARAPKAGCPSFWRSHQACSTARHDLHAWGPCPSDLTKAQAAGER